MRSLAIVVFAILFLRGVFGDAQAADSGRTQANSAANIYDSNPDHIWNRLFRILCLRPAETGTLDGVDAIDPLLWIDTRYLVAGPSHRQALNILNEFLRTHAENRIRDPLKRALLQHNLWAVFDWSANRTDKDSKERQELQVRLAEVLRRLALTKKEVRSLPENYAKAIAAQTFPGEYDPANPVQAFLPRDLLQPRGPWVRIKGNFQPVALSHVYACSGRSTFFAFIRLPQGRRATVDYLRTLWNAPDPWIAGEFDDGDNPNLPQFPVGTEVALLRQMNLFDREGVLLSSPITESLQIRVYRRITSRINQHRIDLDPQIARTEQDVYEIRLSDARLMARIAGGLKAVEREASEFPTFQTQGSDPFESHAEAGVRPEAYRFPILGRCAACHWGSGIHSLKTRSLLLKPNRAQYDPLHGNDPDQTSYFAWWEYGDAVPWKEMRYDWGLLNGLWQSPKVKDGR